MSAMKGVEDLVWEQLLPCGPGEHMCDCWREVYTHGAI